MSAPRKSDEQIAALVWTLFALAVKTGILPQQHPMKLMQTFLEGGLNPPVPDYPESFCAELRQQIRDAVAEWMKK